MSKEKKNSFFDFGKGWGIIIFGLLMFWFYAGMVNDSTNVVAPAVAAKLGLQAGSVISMGTIAGIVAVIFFIIMGQINSKIGARVTSFICLILGGIGFAGMGAATSLTMYAVFLCVTTIGAMSAGYIAGGALVTQWFPKKKGIVMGYTTMGHNLSTALFVPLISALVASLGVEKAVLIPTVLVIALAIVGLLFVRNTPQERGINPDNVSDEIYQKEYFTGHIEHDGGWTVKKLFKTKNYWLAAITTGAFQLVTATIIVQMVARNQELGFSVGKAISIMSILAFVGLFGSWAFGAFDNMLGTKKTMMIFGLFYMVALLLNITEIKALVYVSLAMIGLSIGGSANFTTSLPAAVFGRHGFEKVNSVIFPLQALVTSMSFAINGTILNITGNLKFTYVAAAIICVINIILIAFVDEHKYNRDYLKEEALHK